MQTETLPNYGKDILTIASETKRPLQKTLSLLPAILRFIGGMLHDLGIRGFVKLVQQVRRETRQAKALDWSELEQRGLSRADLNSIITKIEFAKAQVDLLGRERAYELRRSLDSKISYPVMEEIFAPPEAFVACGQGDFLPAFKHYFIALMQAMEKRGLEAAQVVEDTPDSFQINVQYCAWATVAARLGDPYYCYFSTCQGDELFFPSFCKKVGVDFTRSGTLATGNEACDQRFSRPRQES